MSDKEQDKDAEQKTAMPLNPEHILIITDIAIIGYSAIERDLATLKEALSDPAIRQYDISTVEKMKLEKAHLEFLLNNGKDVIEGFCRMSKFIRDTDAAAKAAKETGK